MTLIKDSPALVARSRLLRRETIVGHVIGIALTLAGAGMLVAAVIEKLYHGTEAISLVTSGLAAGIPGLALWARTQTPDRVPGASVFAAALAGWIAFSLAGTLPYLLSDALTRFDLALFESVSGFTTTAATVLSPIEAMPRGLLFWRAVTQWIGGISIVVFAVSVLPFVGVGGMELVSSPAPGPATDRLGRRVRSMATRLVPVYFVFTVIVFAAYAVFGMETFDAVTHAFTTVSTGGFSTHDRSFAYFDSASLEWIAILAMVVAGGSYALYWRALRGKPFVLLRSSEMRAYLVITAAFCATAVIWNGGTDGFSPDTIRRTIFTIVSITSTTGYSMLDFDRWADALQLMCVFAVGLGGMAASPAGGFKVFRLLAIMGYARRQLYGQLHPHVVSVIRFGKEIVPELVVTRVVGFFGLFMATGALATFLVAAFGADVRTAISAVATSIGNAGPGLGDVAPGRNYLGLSSGGRGVLMIVMLIGRLEVFPVLLGIVPALRFVGDRLPARFTRVLLRVARG